LNIATQPSDSGKALFLAGAQLKAKSAMVSNKQNGRMRWFFAV